MTRNADGARGKWIERVFGAAVPRLWCPPLTHYRADGSIDEERTAIHWKHMRPHVAGFLVPGSTGDGWEMDDREIEQLSDLALDLGVEIEAYLLLGVLKPDAPSVRAAIDRMVGRLQERAGCKGVEDVLARSRVCGFSVCPPRGGDRSQESIEADLASVLELGLPVALYQLPQVTQNEVEPATFARLAGRFENLILFKDSSGTDRVALDDRGASGAVLLRGAEGDHIRWLRESGGPYDGFLLSSANCFAAELAGIIRALEEGRLGRAAEISARLTAAVKAVFDRVDGLPAGNPFTNANKAMDHFMAHGPGAEKVEPPMLHAGVRLPVEVIRDTGAVLRSHQLLPKRGYLG